MERIFLLLILLTSVKATFSWPIPDESPLGNDTIGTYIWARVDNFDDENNQTYKQYYKTLFEGNSELRILYVGGESENEVKPTSELMLAADSKYKKLLEELHGEFDATVYSLEHRYYDHSYPVHFPEKAEDFKYLTSQQALADVANFINVQNSLNEGKWITIGGSYPGMLSLWFRQLYPKLTVGAIGSSSPVNAVVNFTSFFLVSQNGYKRRHPECHEKLKLAFDEFRGILEKKTDLSILDQLYPNLTSVFDYNTAYGLNNIAYQVVSDAYTQIQTNIDGICSTYNVSTEEPLVELAANFKQTADHIQDKHWGSWLWQVCNEFGFFYSPSHEEFQAKGTYDIKEVFQKECELRFGKDYTYEQIEENVKKSLEYYGGDKPYKGSNAIISNSDLDPWSGQGVEKAESDTVKIFIIRNATHCDDLRAGNNADVLEARPLYIAEIRKWLKGSSHRQSISVFTIILTCITLVAKLF